MSMNIAAVAWRTGVAADTLRKWEQRYGVLQPDRSEGGHRRYSDLDVARVEWLKARLAEGFRIREAAAMLAGGTQETPSTPADLRDAIYAAVARNDPEAVRALLDQAFTVYRLPDALSKVVSPLLERIGAGWANGELTIAQEHAASNEIRARLGRLLAEPGNGVRGPAVLACAPRERHELGILMLGVLLRADGWRVVYLGADTPTEAAVAMAGLLDARALCLSATMADRISALSDALASSRIPADLAVFVGGTAVTPEIARDLHARHVNGGLRRSVAVMRKLRP
jgi:methanogenic corrinoid protein MtbC1